MKILHLCLAQFYIDGYSYQENILPKINKMDGHQVRIIASTETFIDNLNLGYVSPQKYVTEYGVDIERIPYKKVINAFVTHKLRIYPGLYNRICRFSPDVILCHELCFGSVGAVIKYKKENPRVKLYADTHAASYNSGQNWLSLYVLHRGYYRHFVRRALPFLEKYFYIGEAERVFSVDNYGVPDKIMEYYPLGGILISKEEYSFHRYEKRNELGVRDNDILLVHAGKLEEKKRTIELIRAFSAVENKNAKLVIIGSIPDGKEAIFREMINKDNRINYLGWKSGEELQEYLCACDMYCQPGTVSVIMQNAICNRCAVMAYPHNTYVARLDWGNFLWVKTETDMEKVFKRIKDKPEEIERLKTNSYKCAENLLDYHKLASRLYK